MPQYIDKAKVVAEIDAKRDKIKKRIFSIPLTGLERAVDTLIYDILGRIKDFIDTLEVKDANLNREISVWKYSISKADKSEEAINHYVESIAKYFFELELKAQKGD